MELPRLEPIWKKYREKGLSVIAVNTYPDTPGALEFFEENGLTYPQLADRDNRILFYKLGFDKGDEVGLERHIVELLN